MITTSNSENKSVRWSIKSSDRRVFISLKLCKGGKYNYNKIFSSIGINDCRQECHPLHTIGDIEMELLKHKKPSIQARALYGIGTLTLWQQNCISRDVYLPLKKFRGLMSDPNITVQKLQEKLDCILELKFDT